MKIVSLLRISGLFTLLLLGIVAYTYGQSTAQNYVRTRVPRTVIKTTGRLDTLTTNKDSVQSTIQYLDGLGRPIQTVQVYGSPNGQDLVQPQAYDQFGREPIKYQPYSVTPTTAGMYQGTALSGTGGYTGSQQYSFYQITGQSYAPTTTPYAVTVFELSPLQRPVEQGAPGNAWQPYSGSITGSGHTVKMAYANNNNTALSDTSGTRIVALYTAAINSNGSRTLNRAGSNTAVYGANQLSVTISKDENWQSGRAGTVEEYKDKAGRVVLKRTFNWKSSTLEILSTYYVYDDKGLLAYVLPPGAAPDATGAISGTTLSNFCYQYRYDGRGRLTEKKLPGKGWDFVVYNTLDQVVATQDSNQRVNNQWLFSKYDALGRVVLTGIVGTGSADRAAVQSVVDAQTTLWEAATTSGYGYTNNTWPASWISTLSNNFYDTYAFPGYAYGPWGSGTMATPRGMPTGSLITTIKPDGTSGDQLWTVSHYDAEGRVAQTSKQHYLGGAAAYSTGNYDVNLPTYDFNDQVVANSRYHVVNYAVPLAVGNVFYYDHMGRRVALYEEIVSGSTTNPITLIAVNLYNELGQLRIKGLHSTNNGASFLQNLGYTYNPRGWLGTISSSGNLFNEELYYESPSTGKQYNGNISKMLYSGTYSGSKSFTYTYDQLNRLTNATSTGNTLDEGLTYDVMGNITALTRGGQSYSSLTYGYTGNQLTGVSGTNFTTRSYAYDGNGNATSDGGSKTIDYNLLNLPRKVRNGSTELANYTYDATGRKLSNTSIATNDGTWEYIDGITYHNGNVEFIATEEGRAVPNGGGNYIYQYNLKDHLGNVRSTFYNNSGTATVLQEDEYYSFGLRHGLYDAINNRYLYNGKELQTDLANQYDYGARFYDPVIGRWTSVDPLAEKFSQLTTYQTCSNNPVSNVDLEGLEGVPFQLVADLSASVAQNPNSTTAKASGAVLGIATSVKNTIAGIINPIPAAQLFVKTQTPQGAADVAGDMALSIYDKVNTVQNGSGFDKARVISESTTDAATVVAGLTLGGKIPFAGTPEIAPIPVATTDAIADAKVSTLEPGPYAGQSIPARGKAQVFTKEERDAINKIGYDTGCHTCGTKIPGTKSGNFVPDHQPSSALVPDGTSQLLFPQCIGCSRSQGGTISIILKANKTLDNK
ncbi:RHS repeat-associated core domain-containing protein [Mucilaginibacter mali]|uniref:RHS repeat-associated core domain-containing protein n=1 Tax=Mucilaginibacter mali TaxID=2740462 RepID=A0A7D4QG38_9SPHI|nr:DUF6443 domain-containing protein [Mucilaginibacter mali]QKJ30792.1 RHS repeat-associated core domain-containing protein [Mucilaginibacter mali]